MLTFEMTDQFFCGISEPFFFQPLLRHVFLRHDLEMSTIQNSRVSL